MTGRIITVTNQKGGVGKTTTAINLAASLALADQRVLLVDLDPQGNLHQRRRAARSTRIGRHHLRRARERPRRRPTLRDPATPPSTSSLLVPCGQQPDGRRDRAGVAARARDTAAALSRAASRDEYDRIFIDCPPSLGLLTLNALVAADAVLIPLHCEYFALEGLADLVATLRRVRASLNPSLDIEGVLLTMHDERTNLGQQVARDVREFFKEKVFRTVIPRNVRLGEAPSHGKPVILYDVKSRGAEAYLSLAREMLAQGGTKGSRLRREEGARPRGRAHCVRAEE